MPKKVLCLLLCLLLLPIEVIAASDGLQESITAAALGSISKALGASATDSSESSVWWDLDDDGMLTIGGSGSTQELGEDTEWDEPVYPWSDKADNVIKVVIQDGITELGSYSFAYFDNLLETTISDSVTSIGEGAFCGCNNLKTITLPSSLKKLGEEPFSWCANLESIEISSINEYYCTIDGVLYDKSVSDILCYPLNRKSTSFVVPNTVTYIRPCAFQSSNLREISLPESITSIEYRAFSGCMGLASVSVPAEFNAVVGNEAFYGCESLTGIDLGSVTELGYWVFAYSGLQSITLPGTVTSIGYGAFESCSQLEEVSLDCSLTQIESYMFYGCSSLKTVHLPGSIKEIGYNAFDGCESLQDVYYSGSQDTWESIDKKEEYNEPLLSATIHYKEDTVQRHPMHSSNDDKNLDVSYTSGTGQIIVSGDVSDTAPVLVASFDENGRFLGLECLTNDGSAAVDNKADTARVLWVNTDFKPKSEIAEFYLTE